MSPSRDTPVELVYPDGKAVRFSRERMTGYWLAVDAESGETIAERDTLSDAIEAVGRVRGVEPVVERHDTEPEEARELNPSWQWQENEDGEHWLEQEDEWL